MLASVINEQIEKFTERQAKLIADLDTLNKWANDLANDDNFGSYPFIVLDEREMVPFLVLKGEGNYVRLPPFYDLTEDCLSGGKGHSRIIPTREGVSTLGLLPVDADFEFPSTDPDEYPAIDEGFIKQADDAFNLYMEGVVSLSKGHIAKQLIHIWPLIREAMENSGTDTNDEIIRGMPQIFFKIFSKAQSDAAESMQEMLAEQMGEESDD